MPRIIYHLSLVSIICMHARIHVHNNTSCQHLKPYLILTVHHTGASCSEYLICNTSLDQALIQKVVLETLIYVVVDFESLHTCVVQY